MRQKRFLLAMMVVGMISSAALAVTPMGPPVSGLAAGQFSLGLAYGMTRQSLELSGPYTNLRGAAELDDFQRNLYMGCIGYGVSDNLSAHVLLGMADAEFGADPGDDFTGDIQFAYGLQVNRTLHESGNGVKWGSVCQYLTGKSEDKISGPSISRFGGRAISASSGSKMRLDWYQIQLAVGPVVQVNEDVSIYGGPFLHFFDGDLLVKTPGSTRQEHELQQSIELGGYIGGMLNLGSNTSLFLEFLISDQAWGAGIGAMFAI